MTETNAGRTPSRRRIACHSAASEASSLGGKNSNEIEAAGAASRAGIEAVTCGGRSNREGSPVAMLVNVTHVPSRRLPPSTMRKDT